VSGPQPEHLRHRLFLRTDARELTWPPPDARTSQFHQARPAPGLRDHVAKIRWGREWIAPDAPVVERIVPDGRSHLLFVLSNASAGGPYGLALGASSEPTVVRLAGHIEHVELELRPGAVAALLGVPAGELAGRAITLGDLWGDRAAVVRDQLLDTHDDAARVQIVQRSLERALAERRPQTPAAVGEALRRIEGAGGDLRVRDLASGLGLSDRRLEQLFHWHVGLSPKASCRLARFRATVELLADTPHPERGHSWAELALEGGFSDQSHLVNEFRALTGLAPRDFQRRAGFGFLQDRSAGDRYLPGKRTGRKAR
jgi:AraC-like DNA-binding protein